MRSREVACGLVGSVLVAWAQACSVFSGWSDLQDGAGATTRSSDSGRENTQEDSGGRMTTDASSADDVQSPGEGGPGLPPHCSEQGCAPRVCCLGFLGGAPSCATSCTLPNTTITCAGAADCPAFEVCCLLATRVTQCQLTCDGDPIVCNPDEARPCASGICSTGSAGTSGAPGLGTCQ